MKSDLLVTKFHKPNLPANRVERPLLIRKLNEGLALGCQLTLVSAPAGFGKTTCICEWLNEINLPTAWLSLDKSDDDPIRFFTYFIAALQNIDSSLGKQIEGVLDAGQMPPVDVITTIIINDILLIEQPFILILDDFHVIQDGGILQVLDKLLNNQPRQMHLVLMTREDPVLPLARLRANFQMTEIRAGDLRFTDDEAKQLLTGITGILLGEQDLAALESRTEGWIVGLKLAGLSMRGRKDPSEFIASLNGSHRYILSYLTEEVLSQQSDEVQSFLLQTSILDRLSGDLCDAITGRTDSGQLLEHLLNANLFLIPLDDERQWYRYHRLFADLLRNQQNRIRKALVIQLHQRASLWYEQNGRIDEAIGHSLAALDYPRAVQMVETHALSMVMKGYGKVVERWMQSIPAEWQVRSPKACLSFGWMYLLRGTYDRIPTYLNLVEGALLAMDPASTETLQLKAEWLALQSNLNNIFGKPQESIEKALQSLQIADLQNLFVQGVAYLGMGGAYRILDDYPRLVDAYQKSLVYSRAGKYLLPEMISVSAIMLTSIQYGRLHYAFDEGSRVIFRLENEGGIPSPISGSIYGGLGIVHYQWNELEKAEAMFTKAGQLSMLSGHNAGVVYNKVLMSRIFQAKGNLEASARATQEAVDLLQAGTPIWIKPEVVDQQVRIALAQKNPVLAEGILKQYGISIQEGDLFSEKQVSYSGLLCLSALRLLTYMGQETKRQQVLQTGLDLAERLIKKATERQQIWVVLQALVLVALMNSSFGKTEQSLDALEKALELAEPEGYIRIFLDEGVEVADLLKRCRMRRAHQVKIDTVLSAFGPDYAWVESQQPNEALVEPLTDRELEVLGCIAEGLKYSEIAEKLVITLNTVRFYVKEIYSKLNVDNRTKAVEVARKLGLF